MVLQYQRLLEIVFLIRLWSDVDGGSLELDVIMNEHTVMKDCHGPWRDHGSIPGKAWSAKENVEALPFTGFTARVHYRDMLLVNARRLAVRISAIVVGIEDLNLVPSLKEHSAIAAILSFALDLRGRTPLDVKLAIAKSALRQDVPGISDYGKSVSGDFPFRRARICVLPFGEILPVEKHNRVRRRRSSHPWSHDSRNRLPNLRELRV